jgi:hypothetical protein
MREAMNAAGRNRKLASLPRFPKLAHETATKMLDAALR